MKFVKLTKKEGQKISINADKVLYFEQLEEETIIHFSNGTVSVTEKADDIVSVFKQEEVESKEIIKPDAELSRLYQEKYDKFKEIYPSVKELYKKL